jgi:hypothetical protein
LRNRAADLFDRFHDPHPRAAAIRIGTRSIQLAGMLRALEAPPAEVDVNPITRQLGRRLQQKSILYLMGPGKMLDRVRQVPALLARLPRTTWDFIMKGKLDGAGGDDANQPPREVPDFGAILAEQLAVVQSRIDDVIRSSSAGPRWIEHDGAGYDAVRFDPDRAAAIARDELDQLKNWLESKWNATPRDTAVLEKVLHYVPGGRQLTRGPRPRRTSVRSSSPRTTCFFGHVDLMTWAAIRWRRG